MSGYVCYDTQMIVARYEWAIAISSTTRSISSSTSYQSCANSSFSSPRRRTTTSVAVAELYKKNFNNYFVKKNIIILSVRHNSKNIEKNKNSVIAIYIPQDITTFSHQNSTPAIQKNTSQPKSHHNKCMFQK